MTETQPQNRRRSKAGRFGRRPARPGGSGLLASDEPQLARRRRLGLRARLAYAFDTAIARRPQVVLVWLGLITLLVALVAAAIVTLSRMTGVNGDDAPDNPLEAFWQTLLRIIDTGTVANDAGWPARLIGLLVTLAGIFLAGALIGLIANLIDQKISELRKGKSVVLEQDHTLILGWSPRVPTIVGELVTANASRRRSAIVIVADEDKTQMEDTLRGTLRDTGRTRIVCRSGAPWDEESLAMGNVERARSVIVTAAAADADAVKALLGIHAAVGGRRHAPLVAEVIDPGLGDSLESIMGDDLVTVCSDRIVAELTAQACRQRGIGAIFSELLDFEGCELYFAPAPPVATFGEALLAYAACAPIGIETEGGPLLNPPPERALAPGEQLIVVAEDDGSIVVDPVAGTVAAGGDAGPSPTRPGHLVVIGWSSLGPQVVREMDELMDPGTTVEVIVDPALVDPATVPTESTHVTLTVSPQSGGPEAVAGYALRNGYDQAIVLGYRDHLTPDEADARTLLTVLALRTVGGEHARHARTVIELLDQRHTQLAEATGADDFVVSDQLTSQMLAQLSENPHLREVFAELFSGRGAFVRLRRPVSLALDERSTFADVVASAAAQGQTAFGLVDPATSEVRLSPDKRSPLGLTADWRIAVIAGR